MLLLSVRSLVLLISITILSFDIVLIEIVIDMCWCVNMLQAATRIKYLFLSSHLYDLTSLDLESWNQIYLNSYR